MTIIAPALRAGATVTFHSRDLDGHLQHDGDEAIITRRLPERFFDKSFAGDIYEIKFDDSTRALAFADELDG